MVELGLQPSQPKSGIRALYHHVHLEDGEDGAQGVMALEYLGQLFHTFQMQTVPKKYEELLSMP